MHGKQIPVPTTELIGTFLETLGYGVYLVVFPQCLRIMLRKKLGTTITTIFVASIIANFLLITLHIVVDLTRAFAAFTANMSVPNAPEIYYANVNTHLNITKNAAYCSATLLADALLVLYRTFIVWGRSFTVIILPILLFILDFAMSVWFTWSVNEAHPGSSVLVSTVFARSKYFFMATLTLNLLCTVLIAYKIWKVQNGVSSYVSGPSRGANAMSIILESAAIYSAALTCLIGASSAGSSVMFFWLNSMPPLIGSVFSYIILRSSTDIKRFNTNNTLSNTGNMMFATGATSDKTNGGRAYKHHSSYTQNSSEVEGVHVRLQQIVHRDDIDIDMERGKVDDGLKRDLSRD